MIDAGETAFLSSCCPCCGAKSVSRIPWTFGSGRPTFKCDACNARLTTRATRRMLLALPFAALAFPAAAFFCLWLSRHLHRGMVLSGLQGGIIGGVSAYAYRLVYKGLFFRRWTDRGAR